MIIFYGENRATVGQGTVGPFLGSFDWQPERRRIDVPARAREAVLRIGLLGAVGELDVDQVELKAVKDGKGRGAGDRDKRKTSSEKT